MQAPSSPRRVSARLVVADGVVVRGLAPDDAAERDEAVIAACAGDADGGGDLEGARDLDHLGFGAGRVEGGAGPGHEVVGDVLVVGGDDDQDADGGVEGQAGQGCGAPVRPCQSAFTGRVPTMERP